MKIDRFIKLDDSKYCGGCPCFKNLGGDNGADCGLYHRQPDVEFEKPLTMENYNKWRDGRRIYPYVRLEQCIKENDE